MKPTSNGALDVPGPWKSEEHGELGHVLGLPTRRIP